VAKAKRLAEKRKKRREHAKGRGDKPVWWVVFMWVVWGENYLVKKTRPPLRNAEKGVWQTPRWKKKFVVWNMRKLKKQPTKSTKDDTELGVGNHLVVKRERRGI